MSSLTAAKFVSALAADGAIDEDSLSNSELQNIYAPLTQQVNDSLATQERVLSQVQVSPVWPSLVLHMLHHVLFLTCFFFCI